MYHTRLGIIRKSGIFLVGASLIPSQLPPIESSQSPAAIENEQITGALDDVADVPASVADNFQLLSLDDIGTRQQALMLHEGQEDLAQMSYRLQGDPLMYTDNALKQRLGLSQHPTVLACIDLFWNLVRNPSENITREQYTALHLRLTKALHREFRVQHARVLSMHEAQIDLGQAKYMTKEMFRRALFEVVDHWTLQIDLHHYVDFLIQLFIRISEFKPGIDPSLSIQDMLQQMLRKASDNAAIELPIQLRLLSDISRMEPGTDGEWTQQIPGSVRIDELILLHNPESILSLDDSAFWIDPVVRRQNLDCLRQRADGDRRNKIVDLIRKGVVSADDILYMIQNGLLTAEELADAITNNPGLVSQIGDPVKLLSQLKPFLSANAIDRIATAVTLQGANITAPSSIDVKTKKRLSVDIDSHLKSLQQGLKDESEDIIAITPVVPFPERRAKPKAARDNRSVHKAILIQSDRTVVRSNKKVLGKNRISAKKSIIAELEPNARVSNTRIEDQSKSMGTMKYAALEPTGPIYRRLKKELYCRLLQERMSELQMEPSTMNGTDKHCVIVWDTDAFSSETSSLDASSILSSVAVLNAKHKSLRKPMRPLAWIREAPLWKTTP